jgi:hypothetical protein
MFYLKMETESSLQNDVLNKNRTVDNAQKHIICRLEQHLMQSTFKLWFSSLAPEDGIMPEVDHDHFLPISVPGHQILPDILRKLLQLHNH